VFGNLARYMGWEIPCLPRRRSTARVALASSTHRVPLSEPSATSGV
jgi:hypothetical protein